jgi:phosphoadenosine phosphosulfate reductase
MVLLDMIAEDELPIAVITLDTGRLHEATRALIERTRVRYGIAIEMFVPDAKDVERYVRAHGASALYAGVALRQSCGGMRKGHPLAPALTGRGGWVTGLRLAQSATAAAIAVATFDREHGLPKLSPLAHWTDAQVRDYLEVRKVPCNSLRDLGAAFALHDAATTSRQPLLASAA